MKIESVLKYRYPFYEARKVVTREAIYGASAILKDQVIDQIWGTRVALVFNHFEDGPQEPDGPFWFRT